MGTELNLDFLRGMGFEPPDSGPNDLVVAVRADRRGGAGRSAGPRSRRS